MDTFLSGRPHLMFERSGVTGPYPTWAVIANGGGQCLQP